MTVDALFLVMQASMLASCGKNCLPLTDLVLLTVDLEIVHCAVEQLCKLLLVLPGISTRKISTVSDTSTNTKITCASECDGGHPEFILERKLQHLFRRQTPRWKLLNHSHSTVQGHQMFLARGALQQPCLSAPGALRESNEPLTRSS